MLLGVRLQNTTVFRGATIQAHSWIKGAIIGWQSKVGKWVNNKILTQILNTHLIGSN